MGNQSTALQNYELGDALPITNDTDGEDEKTGWVFYPAKHTDGSLASVFFYDAVDTESDIVDNASKYYKVLRHPGIPRFISLSRTQDGWMLITERLTPLARLVDKLTPTEICAGLHSILDTLAFLHDKACVSHNCISVSSIFVGADGGWRLGGLEFVCPLPSLTMSHISRCRLFYPGMPRPPEDTQKNPGNETKLLPADFSRARDAYCFGVLAEYLLSYLDTLGDLRKTFELRIQDECLHTDANKRPAIRSLLSDGLFSNDFLEILHFLKNVTLKSADEKNTFFSGLAKRLFQLPAEVLARRLVKHLLARFVLLEESANKHVLPHLLMPATGSGRRDVFMDGEVNPLLPEDLFRRYVIPEVFKILHVRDIHVRSVLLHHFAHYVRMFDDTALRKFIFPQILLGLRDRNDALVELTLHALAALVPILGGDTVIGAQRAKLFKQSVPKFCIKNGGQLKGVMNNGITGTRIEHEDLVPNGDKRLAEKERRRELIEQRKEERRQRRERLTLQKEANDVHSAVVSESVVAISTNTAFDDEPAVKAPPSPTKSETDDDVPSSDEHWSDTADASIPAIHPPDEPPITVDWSNVTPVLSSQCVAKQKGVLQLKTQKVSQTSPPKEQALNGQAKVSKGPSEKRQPSRTVDRPLGAEFDVMAITVTSTESTSDDDPIAAMFAQMQPVIPATPSLLSMLAADTAGTQKPGLFAVAECNDTDEGWGEDFDWNIADDQ